MNCEISLHVMEMDKASCDACLGDHSGFCGGPTNLLPPPPTDVNNWYFFIF